MLRIVAIGGAQAEYSCRDAWYRHVRVPGSFSMISSLPVAGPPHVSSDVSRSTRPTA